MKPTLALAALAALLSLNAIARADTLYNVSATLDTDKNGDNSGRDDIAYNISGTLSINSDGTSFTADLTGTAHPAYYPAEYYDVSGTGSNAIATIGDESKIVTSLLNAGDTFDVLLLLFLPESSLVGYQGGAICSMNTSCTKNSSVQLFLEAQPWGEGIFDSGTVTLADAPAAPPSAVTPEPASITLFGVGLLGAAAVIRRQLRNAL